ncbi:hypothetical protein [Providencia alcalifaciens]|uniref:hypothetical protein n=1 Tax=Providencia alcalifaciens TaxID=126385 RepID=UPI003D9935BB
MSAMQIEKLKNEHTQLQSVLQCLIEVAARLPLVDWKEQQILLKVLHDELNQKILPHEQQDEQSV